MQRLARDGATLDCDLCSSSKAYNKATQELTSSLSNTERRKEKTTSSINPIEPNAHCDDVRLRGQQCGLSVVPGTGRDRVCRRPFTTLELPVALYHIVVDRNGVPQKYPGGTACSILLPPHRIIGHCQCYYSIPRRERESDIYTISSSDEIRPS
jgi:hypothetical protein